MDILKQIMELLSQIELNQTEKCHIMAETGYDESVIVGTDDSFISLAKRLLEIVYYSKDPIQNIIEFDIEDVSGRKFLSTDEVKDQFDELADVWPVCVFIAKDNTSVQSILKLFRT